MTSIFQEDAKYAALLTNLIDSCSKCNYKDLTFLSNEQTFKDILIEIEPKLEEISGVIEITKDSSFGIRYGNFFSLFKAIEVYLTQHTGRDTFTTINIQSLIVINEVLQNDTQQLILLAEILLFLTAISSKKTIYLDKVSEMDEVTVCFFFSLIEKYLFIDADELNRTTSKPMLAHGHSKASFNSNVNAQKYYEKEKKNYINIIKDYEQRMSKMKETIEGLEKAKAVLDTKLNDQIRENQMMNRNQNKTESIQEQLITNTLTNNDLLAKLNFKNLEIEKLKKEIELNSKHSIGHIAKLEEQIEVQKEKLNEAKEIRSQYDKLQAKYKNIKLIKDHKGVGKEDELIKAIELRNNQIEIQIKEKKVLMAQIEKLNHDILEEKDARSKLEFEKKKMEYEISDLKNDIQNQSQNSNIHVINPRESTSLLANVVGKGITMDGMLDESIDRTIIIEDKSKLIQTPSNTMRILELNDEILKLKEEKSQLALREEEAKAKTKSISAAKEKMEIQMQKYELEIQKQLSMIERIRNEMKRYVDDNKCLNEKIKEMSKAKKSEADLLKKDILTKAALIESIIDEKKQTINEMQKLQKEFEHYKQQVSGSGNAGGGNDKKGGKGNATALIQQQSISQGVISNSEILSLKNEIQNLKLALIQKEQQIDNLKEHQINNLTEEEINTKLSDLDFYKKSYEEQKNRVNKEHELISDSLHKLAVHFMGLKDNLQNKVKSR